MPAAYSDDVHLTLAFRAGRVADHLPVEHGLVERHRDVILSLEPDCGFELIGLLDRREAQRADRDALVGDPEPDIARELVLGEQLSERVSERLGVGHLAFAEHAGL
jgi:hypothetical protein